MTGPRSGGTGAAGRIRRGAVGAVLLGLAIAARADAASGEPSAWIRFDDGTQDYRGTRYRFLGDGDLELVFEVPPRTGQVLVLQWGAKNDERTAVMTVDGQPLPLRGGGYDGFRPLRVDLPAGGTGDVCRVTLRAGAGKAAFLAGAQVQGAGDLLPLPPGTRRARFVRGGSRLRGSASGEAYPDMRPLWDRTPPPLASTSRVEALYRTAEANARRAAEGLYRCRRFVEGWLARADPATGLIPRNLRESRDFWNGRDSAADNYPFMVLTAAFTDRPLFEGRMLDMLRTEARVTARLDRLPDDYVFSRQTWRREPFDLDATIFDGAEYVKDGLIPLTEWLGPSPWSERMIGIMDDLWKHAAVDTPAGKIPTLNFEVNGDLMQACARLFWFTGDRKYLDWAIRLGDYYLLGGHHPTRDMAELKLGDHSCEVINGLSELYVACAHAAPAKREAYRAPLHELYDRLLQIAVNEHGLVYLRVNTRTGAHSDELTDNWGYNFDGLYTVFLLDGTTAYRDAVRKALGSLKEHYTGRGGMCQSNTADGYADSVEGAITLFNREPVASAADWIETEIRTMWAKQQPDGVIEGWHGDGNSARTTIMYVLWKTQGARLEPWRADVRLGAARDGDAVLLSLAADTPWSGRVIFDAPRHRTTMRLPLDYPRINQFPEWFTVEPEQPFAVRTAPDRSPREVSGKDLLAGLPAELRPGEELRWRLERKK